jgi:hypothetical protein
MRKRGTCAAEDIMHTIPRKRRECPPATLEKIADLKRIYGLDLSAADSPRLRET